MDIELLKSPSIELQISQFKDMYLNACIFLNSVQAKVLRVKKRTIINKVLTTKREREL